MKKEKIVGIGELLWDLLPQGKALGGAPANFAYHASQFGFEGCVVSAVGRDPLGEEINALLSQMQLKGSIAQVDYPTGTVQVTLDAKGVPQYAICEEVAWDNIPFSEPIEALARDCKAVCFGSLAQRSACSRATINRFLELVPADAYKIFDINLRQHYYNKAVIQDSLAKCNILKINDDEVAVVAQLFDLPKLSESEVCMHLLASYNLKMVIETKGAIGSSVFTAEQSSYLDTPRVKVVDTVGAGDSFTGAFIGTLLNGKSLHEAHRKAVEVAAYVCAQQGAMPAMPAHLTASENKPTKL